MKEKFYLTVDQIAQVCHEANTAFCVVAGDDALPHWENLEESYRQSTRHTVQSVLQGATHEEMHACWRHERMAQGWIYGEQLDRANKVHPSLVPYPDLPKRQRQKDALFSAVVGACR